MKGLTIIAILVTIVIGYFTVAATARLWPFPPKASSEQTAVVPAPTQTVPEPVTTTPAPTSPVTPQALPVPTQVLTMEVATDSSWKSLETAVKGWTSVSFDDSWWSNSVESESPLPDLSKARAIWYPERPMPLTAYFRKRFDINGVEVISGRTYAAINTGDLWDQIPDAGKVDIYMNDRFVGTLESGGYMNNWFRKKEFDVASYLTLGENVIAIRVEFYKLANPPISGRLWWGLSTTVRYAAPVR